MRTPCEGKSPCDMGFTRDALKNYVGPDDRLSGPSVTLVAPEQNKLAKYVAPEYPPLAKMAGIEGRVTLELTADSQRDGDACAGNFRASPAGERGRTGRK